MTVRTIVRRVLSAGKATLKASAGLVFVLAALWCSAGAPFPATEADNKELSVVVPDTANPVHWRIESSLKDLWTSTVRSRTEPELAVVTSPGFNAASLGRGRFVVWEDVGELSRAHIDAILAHEVAHDVLRHGRDQRELQSVTHFFGEVLAILFGDGPRSERRMQGWVNDLVVPSYTRSQELEADARAVEILRQVGYAESDSVLAEALRVLVKRHGDTGGGFFDTHPATSDRITRLLQ